MNITTLKVSFISAAALTVAASQAVAQTPARVSVKVPFEFSAGPTVLPAGTYDFSEDRTGVMYISSAENHKAIVVLTNPEAGGNGKDYASVKFDKVNGQYSLTEVSMVGEPTHRLIRLEDRTSGITSKLGVTNATAKGLR